MRRITADRIRRGLARLGRHVTDLMRHPIAGLNRRTPVDYRDWLERRGHLTEDLYPADWALDTRVPGAACAEVAVVMHVHFPELVPELLQHLANIPVPFDLLVTNSSGQDVTIAGGGLPKLNHSIVLAVENHGRDIFPLIQLINSGLLAEYELVCKVHTKKSTWRENHDLGGSGVDWKDELLEALLGNTERVCEILEAFETDRTIGQVTASGSILGSDYWGANYRLTKELLRRVGVRVKRSELRFCAGSMYWTRVAMLESLRALELSRSDFDEESGQVDGTTAHAVERAIGLLTLTSGHRLTAVT